MKDLEQINPVGLDGDRKLSGFADLALFLGGSEDSWTGVFLGLVAKSDPRHRHQLSLAFPVAVRAWEIWVSQPDIKVYVMTRELNDAALAHDWRTVTGELREPYDHQKDGL